MAQAASQKGRDKSCELRAYATRVLSVLPGIADGHNADDSGDPNGDTQNGQDASHLVS
jgi:hypothetical protein